MPEVNTVKSVRITGLFGRLTLSVGLGPELNIIFGRNGTGKTTLLHVLANLLRCDFQRFSFLPFDSLFATFHNGSSVRLTRLKADDNSHAITIWLNDVEIGIVSKTIPSLPPEALASIRDSLSSTPVYLPAFRSILEAAPGEERLITTSPFDLHDEGVQDHTLLFDTLLHSESRRRGLRADSPILRDKLRVVIQRTLECRRWFGEFTPIITYPAIRDVQRELLRELRDAQQEIAGHDRAALSSVFVQVLHRLLGSAPILDPADDVPALLARVQSYIAEMKQEESNLPSNYAQLQYLISSASNLGGNSSELLAGVLHLYVQILQERLRMLRGVFRRLRQFTESVNRFLENKKLEVRDRRVGIRFGEHVRPLDVLSSGERHLLTLLFSATHMSKFDGTLLIDEPELSLHVEWQRLILEEIMKQAPGRQVIVCTHAPEITALHMRSTVQLKSTPECATETGLWADKNMRPDES